MKLKKQEQKNKSNKLPKFIFGIAKDKEFLSENLSALVSSGISIKESLDSIQDDVKSSGMKKIISYIKDSVDEGVPFWKTLKETGIFKDHIISLIRIGEETGRLSENLKVVAKQEQKSRVFASKIKSAMMYPVFVMFVAMIVAVLIAWFILPRLAVVFSQLDIDLPIVTRWLINAGEFLQLYGSIAVPSFVVGLFLLIFFVFIFKKTRFIGQYIIFKIPGINRLIKEVEVSRFGFLLGTLLEAGIPIIEALDSLKKATSFNFYKKFYSYVSESVTEGQSIETSFKKYKKTKKLIPSPIQQMVFASEKSGNLSETLKKIGEIYEEKTEDTTKNLTVILEPVLLVIVWLGVVGVALAVILPIYSLIGGFNQ